MAENREEFTEEKPRITPLGKREWLSSFYFLFLTIFVHLCAQNSIIKHREMTREQGDCMGNPIVRVIDDNNEALSKFESELKDAGQKERDILLSYPTVYVHDWEKDRKKNVYIGESNDIIQRTKQHYLEAENPDSWQCSMRASGGKLYIIAHEHFNKSLTLDIENRLIEYMLCNEKVTNNNKRVNPQNKYYPDKELDNIFEKIWRALRRTDPSKEVFLPESQIKDSAIYKASPLRKLTPEQEAAQELILERAFASLAKQGKHQMVFVEGEAGTGKTVLNSSTFYRTFLMAEEKDIPIDCVLMVNHDEQAHVYEEIAARLGLTKDYGEVVSKPTRFINTHSKIKPVDIAFVDEAHLLLTQGKQSYQGSNQLADIRDRAKVTVVMFDPNQVLTTEEYLEKDEIAKLRKEAQADGNYIVLQHQLRVSASESTIQWLDAFTKEQRLLPIPAKDEKNYEIKIFATPEDLANTIKAKAGQDACALSRLVATYDWPYSATNKPEAGGYWEVKIGNWHKPWNREIERYMPARDKKGLKKLAWAEQPPTINEVGSTFTIQGFDLSYAGVILGPSVTYRDGKIVFDSSKSHSDKATRNRTMRDNTKQNFAEELLQHEVLVLMTRGVKGLYIYACDKELREALEKASTQSR